MTAAIPASRFDGRHAEAVPVHLVVEAGSLRVETPSGVVLEHERLDQVSVSDLCDRAPRMIVLSNGVTLEVPDEDRSLDRALRQGNVPVPLAVRMQRWGPAVAATLVALVSLLAIGYLKGVPVAVRWIAAHVPEHLERRVGDRVLAVLDRHYFKPSLLVPPWREELTRRFAEAAGRSAPGVRYRLEFRRTSREDINALTLPGGTIVLLDELVLFAKDDTAVLAVLGHELGHVVGRHPSRAILHSMAVGWMAGLLWGDLSGATAGVPAVLGLLRYSREFEREADDFAVAFLKAQGLSARPLYFFFSRLQTSAHGREAGTLPSFLTSHPAMEERLERLRPLL